MYPIKEKIKKISRRGMSLFIAGLVVGMLAMVLISISAMYGIQQAQADKIQSLEAQIASYQEQIYNMEEAQQAELDDLNKTIADKDAAYDKLISDMEAEACVEMELVKKYSYVIDKVDPTQGFTLGMMYHVDKVCKEKDINPHMVFAIFDIESDYDIDVKNPKSTATGLGQLLASTGRLIYEGQMGNPKGSYTHEMAKNGYTNIDIVVTYLKYLKDTYGSINVMINGYSGDQSGTYYGWYVAQMKANGQDPAVNRYI